MDFWQKARSFADEAAKQSKELTLGSSKLSDMVSETAKRSNEIAAEASKRSQEITIGSFKLSNIVSETAKCSREIAAEASKRADHIKSEATKRAEQIKSLAERMAPSSTEKEAELERFGVTEELREFVKEITMRTFQHFPLEDDSEMSNVPTVSNVRQDFTEWQEKHASLVLTTVKEISKLRYELCPRVMKERKFWRIYFILMNSHVAPGLKLNLQRALARLKEMWNIIHRMMWRPDQGLKVNLQRAGKAEGDVEHLSRSDVDTGPSYEKQYMEEATQKSAEQVKDEKEKPLKVGITSKPEAMISNEQSKTSASSSAEQDLDVFLLGGDSDEGLDDGDGGFDDDFDKMVDGSDDEQGKL